MTITSWGGLPFVRPKLNSIIVYAENQAPEITADPLDPHHAGLYFHRNLDG